MNLDKFYSEKGREEFYKRINLERKKLENTRDKWMKKNLEFNLEKSIQFYEKGRAEYLNSLISASKINPNLYETKIKYNVSSTNNLSFSKN